MKNLCIFTYTCIMSQADFGGGKHYKFELKEFRSFKPKVV